MPFLLEFRIYSDIWVFCVRNISHVYQERGQKIIVRAKQDRKVEYPVLGQWIEDTGTVTGPGLSSLSTSHFVTIANAYPTNCVEQLPP